jgi:hypothetical protein
MITKSLYQILVVKCHTNIVYSTFAKQALSSIRHRSIIRNNLTTDRLIKNHLISRIKLQDE